MHDEIDFSKVERIAPRNDSWDKVCSRLDAMELARESKKADKFIRFPVYKAIPIAASIALVAITVIMVAIAHTDNAGTENIDIGELASWIDNLGNDNSDFEELDEYGSISYLIR